LLITTQKYANGNTIDYIAYQIKTHTQQIQCHTKLYITVK